MYVGWLAVAQGWYQLQIGVSFESDKSDSYFTRGVRHGCFNGAISLFAAGKTEGAGDAVSLPIVLFSDFILAAARDLCSATKGIESELCQASVSHHAEAARNLLFKMFC